MNNNSELGEKHARSKTRGEMKNFLLVSNQTK